MTFIYIDQYLSYLLSMDMFLMFAFALLVGIPIGISSSTLGLIICAITAAIKKIIQQKRKKGKRVNSIVRKT